MPRQFAKLYETERGQIVVMRESGESGHEIGVYFDAGVPELAVSRVALGFGEGADACSTADQVFEKIQEDGAKRVAFQAMDQITEMFREDA